MARRALSLAVAALAAGALAGCGATKSVTVSAVTTSSSAETSSSSAPTSAHSEPSTPLTDADEVPDPTVGECLNETDTKWSAVDCGMPHDVEVSAIVPSKWDGRDLVARAALRTWTCDNSVAAYLGGPAMATFFAAVPMPAAVDPRSDERVVCLAYQFKTGSETTVARAGDRMRHILADPRQLAKWRLCMDRTTTDKSSAPNFVRCSQQHAAEAVTEVSLGNATAPYPGDAKVRESAKRLCAPKVKAYLGGVTRKDLVLGARGPGPEQWRAGHHRLSCFVNVKGAKVTKSVHGIKHKPLAEYR